MKATNHASGSRRQKAKSAYMGASSSRMETGVFATLGLAGFVAVVIAFASAFTAGESDEGLPMVNYVRSGRLAADARTWAAMVHYLLEPEPGVVTNGIDPS